MAMQYVAVAAAAGLYFLLARHDQRASAAELKKAAG